MPLALVIQPPNLGSTDAGRWARTLDLMNESSFLTTAPQRPAKMLLNAGHSVRGWSDVETDHFKARNPGTYCLLIFTNEYSRMNLIHCKRLKKFYHCISHWRCAVSNNTDSPHRTWQKTHSMALSQLASWNWPILISPSCLPSPFVVSRLYANSQLKTQIWDAVIIRQIKTIFTKVGNFRFVCVRLIVLFTAN